MVMCHIKVSQKGTSNLFRLYSKTTGQVRAYDQLPVELLIWSIVHQSCSPPPFLFKFVIDIPLEIKASSLCLSEIDLVPYDSLVHLEYIDGIGLFGEYTGKM